MERQEANRKLIRKLLTLVEEHPELRFGQILQSFYFVKPDTSVYPFSWKDEFYLESKELVRRVYQERE